MYCGKSQIVEILPTEVTKEDLENAWVDSYGAKYSLDRKKLLKVPDRRRLLGVPVPVKLKKYEVRQGTVCIADHAFIGCSSLQQIIIPDSVTSIGDRAFYGCESLQEITIPASVTSIADSAFRSCSSLKELILPSSVTTIGESAFYNCRSLEKLRLPDGVTSIGDSVFSGCSSLREITIPDSVTSIADSAFKGCASLKELTLPSSVTTIGESAFWDCSFLGKLILPNGVTDIGESAFWGCDSLEKLTLPASVTYIRNCLFLGYSSLKELTLLASVIYVREKAFVGCISLEKLTLYASEAYIGKDAFSECSLLQSICVHSDKLDFFKGLLFGWEDKIEPILYAAQSVGIQPSDEAPLGLPHYLFFETETTGIPNNSDAPSSDIFNWPRLVRLGWIVTDRECNVLNQHDLIIRPDGFSIPFDSQIIHGITTERARNEGVTVKCAIEEFLADFLGARAIVAHNVDGFDKRIIGAELVRLHKRDVMDDKKSVCTMIASKKIGDSWLTLECLHKELFGCEFDDSRDTMSKVLATIRCFKELKRKGIISSC